MEVWIHAVSSAQEEISHCTMCGYIGGALAHGRTRHRNVPTQNRLLLQLLCSTHIACFTVNHTCQHFSPKRDSCTKTERLPLHGKLREAAMSLCTDLPWSPCNARRLHLDTNSYYLNP